MKKIYDETERKRKRKSRLRCCLSLAIAGLVTIGCVTAPLISANADVGGFIATNNSNQGFQYAWSGFSARSRMAYVGGSNYSLRSNVDIIDSFGYVNGENSSDDYTLGLDEIDAGGTDIINYPYYVNYFDTGYRAQLRQLECLYNFETTVPASFGAYLYSSRQQMMNYMRYEYLASRGMQCTISGLDPITSSLSDSVNSNELRGTWIFDEIFSFDSLGINTREFNVNFISNSESFSTLNLYYVNDNTPEIRYDSTPVCISDSQEMGYWVDSAYRTVTFTDSVSDVIYGDRLLTILNSQAVKVSDSVGDDSNDIDYNVGVSMRLWRVDDDGTLELKQLNYTPILDENNSFIMGDYLPSVSELDSMGFLLFDNTLAIFDFNIFLEVPNLPAGTYSFVIDMEYTSPSLPFFDDYQNALSNEQSAMIKFANLSNKIESGSGGGSGGSGGSGGNTEVIYVNSPTEVIWSTVEGFFTLELFPDFHMYHFFMIAIGSLLLGIFLKIFLGG